MSLFHLHTGVEEVNRHLMTTEAKTGATVGIAVLNIAEAVVQSVAEAVVRSKAVVVVIAQMVIVGVRVHPDLTEMT